MANSSEPTRKSGVKFLREGFRALLSDQITLPRATLEAFRRGRANVRARHERATLDQLASRHAELLPEFKHISSSELLEHFRSRSSPSFFSGFDKSDVTATRFRDLLPGEAERVIESAQQVARHHRWPLLGFGVQEFGREINWRCDPISKRVWSLDYHGDVALWQSDGSDIRVLWELNRLAHLVTLGQAYSLTGDEEFAREFFAQVESWREQNPVGRGPNWACAMEVALRLMNLLAAFSCFRQSTQLSEERLLALLTLFNQHAAHITRNLEFSYIATSNHYLSDVAGLLWVAIALPELSAATQWREWALPEFFREIDKQILPDGADYEGTSGYHCFVLELFLYTFVLLRANRIEVEDKYRRKLHAMLVYLRGIVRPDGITPFVGDNDGGHIFFNPRSANDHSYLLALGAAVFAESEFKLNGSEIPPELLWLLGEEGLQTLQQLEVTIEPPSQVFHDAGACVLKHDDLFLMLTANGDHSGRPSSHRHNDLLSLEVFANGRSFIVDPGTYVYTGDLRERHMFRSTAYHSTLEIDNEEQQTIDEGTPFKIGREAHAKISLWKSTPEYDQIVAEHTGYERLVNAVTHRRTVTLYKHDRWWLIEDEIAGKGEHEVVGRFHFDTGLATDVLEDRGVVVRDAVSDSQICIWPLGDLPGPEFESQFVSRHYGSKSPSITAKWSTKITAPWKVRWAIVPVAAGEDVEERINNVRSFIQSRLENQTLDIGLGTLN